jgi:chromosome partitioning protein
LVGEVDVREAITVTAVPHLSLLPSSIDLAGAEVELVSAFSREEKLHRALGPIEADYEIIIVDCPPSLGLLTVNALTAGNGVLVPIQCEYYALEGLGSLQQNIELIRLHLNPSLETIGYVMTMYDGRTRLSEQVVQEVRSHFGDRVFQAKIPRSVRLAEAPSYGEPITVFDPASRGAVAYHRVATELIERLRVTRP